MHEFYTARVVDNGRGVNASVTPADRKGSPQQQQPQFGTGNTIEQALASAMRRPGVRFCTSGDELQAEILTFRERAMSLMIRGNELITLGLR